MPKKLLVNEGSLFDEKHNWDSLVMDPTFTEKKWSIFKEHGQGFMHILKIRKGLFLSINHLEFSNDVEIFFKNTNTFFNISFTCYGNLESSLIDTLGNTGSYVYQSSSGFLNFQCETETSSFFSKHKPLLSIGIFMDLGFLKKHLQSLVSDLPSDFKKILDGDTTSNYHFDLRTSVTIKSIVHEIFNCPYQGKLKTLWLESKTLDLIAHSFFQILPSKDGTTSFVTMHPRDIERILSAEKILLNDLANPPSLLELAELVGLNKNKLTYGFYDLFKTSVFSHLRSLRLNKAMELLKSGELNVTQIALEVGYSQQSSFTKAFKYLFGTNPSDYLK